MLNKKSILITGGTGSFGRAWVRHILKKYLGNEVEKMKTKHIFKPTTRVDED